MNTEKVDAQDSASVEISRNGKLEEALFVSGHYDVKCFDIDGNLKWEDSFNNIVVNEGKADLLTKYFKGAAYTAAWYMGLVNNTSFTTYAPGDTLLSHGGWLESTAYTGSRPLVSFGTASATGGTSNPGVAGTGSLTTSSAVTFVVNASVTILGAFLCTVSSGTSGILYSAGSFTGGSRAVVASDSLLVTYTAQD
jgi:hypothetical protein